MKIILATGIYPPEIGGPATYVHALAQELSKEHTVVVVTYVRGKEQVLGGKGWKVESVSKSFPVIRWFLYAKTLRDVGRDADIVYAFSSISCGVPLVLSRLTKPKRLLRLGGDFFWERFTDWGGKKGLREWLVGRGIVCSFVRLFASQLLAQFDHIIFSTEFQRDIYQSVYKKLAEHSVIENALVVQASVPMMHHTAHTPFRLLFMGRFVAFKNIPLLLRAIRDIPDVYLTLVGQGPQDDMLRSLVDTLGLSRRVQFVAPLSGAEKFAVFASHDLLVLPSRTEISPNTALEARSTGLPVLLTKETGLSPALRLGIVTADLSTQEKIQEEVQRVRVGYTFVAEAAAEKIEGRSWQKVAQETVEAFSGIMN